MTDPTNPRDDDCDQPYTKPIGYLAAYELGRLLSGHDGSLRSAKFGPSPLDADVPVYLNLPRDDRSAVAQVVAVDPPGPDGHGVNWLRGAKPKPGDLLYARSSDAAFKNFHRALCDRFGYAHDEIDWRRDQISLIEHIAKRIGT